MRMHAWFFAPISMLLSACASQSPTDQLQRKETVRICQGNQCNTQSSSTVTFNAPSGDAEAERRLEALTELAQKDPKAAYDLGLRLLRGDGVERNSYQGIEWLRQAGDQGSSAAQLALGNMYLTGYEEMGPDPAEAYAWLSRAAAAGNKEAQKLLPEAAAASKAERANYEVRQAYRTTWGYWLATAPYYWVWRDATWHLH